MCISWIQRILSRITSQFRKHRRANKKRTKEIRKIARQAVRHADLIVSNTKDIDEWIHEMQDHHISNDHGKTPEEIFENSIRVIEKGGIYKHKGWFTDSQYAEVHKFLHKKKKVIVIGKLELHANDPIIHEPLWTRATGHPGIMMLYKVYFTPQTTCFMTPFYKKNMSDMLEKMVEKRKQSLDTVKRWFLDILSALEYLESKQLAHLNLTPSNIFISKNFQAIVGGLGYMVSSEKPIVRLNWGLPRPYRPPEICPTIGHAIPVDGRAVDMWSFGMLASEVLTYFALAKVGRECRDWRNDVWPTMCFIMDERQFRTCMKEHFFFDFAPKETKLALNFVQSFLREDLQMRTRPSFAINHAFLGRGADMGPAADKLWTDHTFPLYFSHYTVLLR